MSRRRVYVYYGILTDYTRCYRLKKECRPSASTRRRNPRNPVGTKTSRLEKKLDGLVSLIKTGAFEGGRATTLQVLASLNDTTANGASQTYKSTPTHNDSGTGSSVSLSSSKDFLPEAMTATREHEPSPAEAEECLANFRTHKLKYLPFLSIPSSTSAQQLRQDRPFLWLCIMALGTRSTSQTELLCASTTSGSARYGDPVRKEH